MTCGLLTEDEFVRRFDWYILHYQESFQATQAISVKKLQVAISSECANEERREKVIFPADFIMSTKCDRDTLEYHNHGPILKLEKEFKL